MVDSVKGVTEYFKANSVVRIRKADCSEEEKERLIKDAFDRIAQGEVWFLGTLISSGIAVTRRSNSTTVT